jgi:hypothetical protein
MTNMSPHVAQKPNVFFEGCQQFVHGLLRLPGQAARIFTIVS